MKVEIENTEKTKRKNTKQGVYLELAPFWKRWILIWAHILQKKNTSKSTKTQRKKQQRRGSIKRIVLLGKDRSLFGHTFCIYILQILQKINDAIYTKHGYHLECAPLSKRHMFFFWHSYCINTHTSETEKKNYALSTKQGFHLEFAPLG